MKIIIIIFVSYMHIISESIINISDSEFIYCIFSMYVCLSTCLEHVKLCTYIQCLKTTTTKELARCTIYVHREETCSPHQNKTDLLSFLQSVMLEMSIAIRTLVDKM